MPQTVARHVTEIGRIRLGNRVAIKSGRHAGEPVPARLKHFRLTSNSKAAMEVCARRYGGAVQAWTIPPEWKDQVPPPDHTWELFTTSDTLDILFHPGGVMRTSWEEWQAGYCVLRCNGRFIEKDGTGQRVGEPCHCPDDPHERKALAMLKPPQACEEISRIAVFLEGVPLGQWRLDTKGFYAPAEIRGLQDIMAACEVSDMLVRAQLRLEWRTDKKMEAGKPSTLIYPVVVIEPRQSADELLAIGEAYRQRQLHPATEPKQLAQHIADLYGDPHDQPAGEDGAEYLAQIEAAILAQPGGDLERWYGWAEKRFAKARTAFSVEDYQAFLAAVRAAAQRRPTSPPPPAKAMLSPKPSPPAEPSPAQLTGQASTGGQPMLVEGDPLTLWKQEEAGEGEA